MRHQDAGTFAVYRISFVRKVPIRRLPRRHASFLGMASSPAIPAVALALSLACSDENGTGPDPGTLAGRAFVVNSIGGTLSVVGRDPEGRLVARNDEVELGPGANAVALAVGEGAVAVPVGATNQLFVFDEATLAGRCTASLPAGSSPNGVAISGGDAYVSLLLAGAVARVDLATCAVEGVSSVGPAPFDVEVLGETLLVVVANIDLTSGTFPVPRLGESFVAFVDALTLELADTVSTSGFNAQFGAFDRDGDLLVVNTGDFGEGNSSLAVIDPVARRFERVLPLGDSAVDVAVSSANLAYVSSFSDGLYVFDASLDQVLRGTENPLFAPDAAGGRRGSSGVAVDRRGNVLSVFPQNFAVPGQVFLFEADGSLSDSTTVGVGPVGIQLETSARP